MGDTIRMPVWFVHEWWDTGLKVTHLKPPEFTEAWGPYIVEVPVPAAVQEAIEGMTIHPVSVKRATP